jgi:hypothetical protein
MADDITVNLDSDLERKLELHPAVESSARASAVAIADEARASAPVMSGAYRESIVVQKSNRGKSGMYRVFASDPKSAWIEFGTANEPAQFNLRNAAEALGFKFVKKG